MIRLPRPLAAVLTGAAVLCLTFPAFDGSPAAAQTVPARTVPAPVLAATTDYAPDEVHVKEGQILTFGHLDVVTGSALHSLDQVVDGCDFPALSHPGTGDDGTCPARRFSAGLVRKGELRNVPGVEQLPKGTYKFGCRVHRPRMTGTLVVE